ncbi:MAG: hypothetical protein HOQ46_22360 [Saccharothrix sp.]|nr:hypothetical protein [Saccharothrix sp.]
MLNVATVLASLSPDGGDQPGGVHIVVPDEPTARLLVEIGRPVAEVFDIALVRLPAMTSPSGHDIVIGTPEQFAARPTGPGARAHLAIVVDVDAPPPDFADRYERVLDV